MQSDYKIGVVQMTAAMIISGTIGAFVLLSGQPIATVVFFRCLIGAMTLFALGFFQGTGEATSHQKLF